MKSCPSNLLSMRMDRVVMQAHDIAYLVEDPGEHLLGLFDDVDTAGYHLKCGMPHLPPESGKELSPPP